MARFVRLASRADLPPGSAREVEYQGRIYALFNQDGVISALDGICPHQGGPLAEGVVQGTQVTCPWHGWQFDLHTGRSGFGRGLTQPCFAVRVEGDEILVAVPECEATP